MNPIEFGANLFAKAKEMQTKTVRACDVIVKIDEELSTMPEPFKMDFMCLVTRAVDKCENMNKTRKVTPTEKAGKWIYGEDFETGHDGWHCNQCGHFEPWNYSLDMTTAKLKLPNHCPNCGSRMMQEVKK